MPDYVTDPLNPNGKKIDVMELHRRNPGNVEPYNIKSFLKHDYWSMAEAILLLAGFRPETRYYLFNGNQKFKHDIGESMLATDPIDQSEKPICQVYYLDGSTSKSLFEAGLPDVLATERRQAYWNLIPYTRHHDISNIKKSPIEWIEWAIDKELPPYWLDYAMKQSEVLRAKYSTSETEVLTDAGAGSQEDKQVQQLTGMAISILPPKLTLEQKAKLKKLDARLCIYDIAKLRYPNDEALRDAYAFDIAKACLLGDLEYRHHFNRHDVKWLCEHPGEKSIMDWVPIGDINVERPTPTPDTRSAQLKRFYANNHDAAEFELLMWDYAKGRRCVIASNDFKQWLITKRDYPILDDCLLPNWFESVLIAEDYLRANWPDSERQAETAGDGDAGRETLDERQSQLYIFIWRVHQFLNVQKKPTAQQLWNEIQHRHSSHDTNKIIQEVDGQRILWCSGYGNEQRQLRSTFNKTLSNIRKNPPFKE